MITNKKRIIKILEKEDILLGVILGASAGYIGAELNYLTHYLLYKKIDILTLIINSTFGVFLFLIFIYLTFLKIKKLK